MVVPPTAHGPVLTRRARGVLRGVAAFVVAGFAGSAVLGGYIDWLWFDAVGYREVFTTVLLTRLAQFAVVGGAVGGALALALVLAYRSRPILVPRDSRADDPIEHYRGRVLGRARRYGVGVPIVVGAVAGGIAQRDWRTTLLFLHGQPFGTVDPEFGVDVGFYTFDLPFYQALLGWGTVAVVVSIVGASAVHVLLGGMRWEENRPFVSRGAVLQIGVLAGIGVLLTGAGWFLGRYELLSSDRSDLFTGATFTDLHAGLPGTTLLAGLAVVCSIAFFVGAARRAPVLPGIATASLLLSVVLVGAAWPALLQRLSVEPNAKAREAESIQRNIAATRQAYGIGAEQVEYVDYSGGGRPSTPAFDDQATVSDVRLLDPTVLSPTFTQLQQRENFYGFPAKLDVDRYEVDGELQDYVVAVRELETASLAGNQRSWINEHTVYTHGDGFVAARADRVDDGGRAGGTGYPVFTVSDTSGQGAIPVEQPRVYFGELIDSYVIVGGAPDAPPREYDVDGTPFTYDGAGGVPIDGWFHRSAFAAHFGERNIVFNEAVGEDSRVIFRQDPRERVAAVAPWLTLDSDPYPAVVDGRITWIVDGYTTAEAYPYAQRTVLGDATTDTLAGTPELPDDEISYIRNSVKATVDAYDGTVTLYAVDPADPVLRTWMSAFPGTVAPASEIPDELRAHFRYPQDLFEVQRRLLARYHVDDPGVFFSTNDFWDVPGDPTQPTGPQPPHYVLAGPPGADGAPSFQLTSPMVGLRRQFMTAYISVSSAPRSYGEFRVLRLPSDSQTLGPQQVQTRFRSSAEVGQELNILQAAETDVLFGNLLTLPTGDGKLLYVEPVYVERTDQELAFPQLNRVLVLYGDQVGYAPTLTAALDEAVGTAEPATGEPASRVPELGSTGGVDAGDAAAEVAAAFERLTTAKASGDFAAEGDALAALQAAIRRFLDATGTAPPT